MEEIKNNIPIHTREAWDKLYARLKAEDLVPAQEVKPGNNLVYYGLRIAAVGFILLVAGLALYLNLNRRPEVAVLKLNTSTETATLIKTLGDGSVIYLAENSLFSFPEEFKSDSRNVKLKGEAFFDIAPDASKPFVIETDEALIQVLGTAFNVKTKNGTGFELFVDRGKVKVTMKKHPSHNEMVVAGEMISTVDNSLVKSKHVAVAAGSWYIKRMCFKDEKLSNIITVLNRNFNTNFVVANEKIGKHKLTVTFQNETAVTMTELICVALNLKSQTINGSVVFSEVGKGAKPY
ncbi:MAG: FecR domain-containing protein [Bacteroidota bacterium]|jgi:ferric-dicitrate binding protein FerR (iron transport regulator)